MIDVDRPREVQTLAAAARCASARGHHAGVKQDWDLQAGGRLEQGGEPTVVWVELLPSRMKLGALQPELPYAAFELADRQLTLPWIDARKTHECVRVLPTGSRQLVVGVGGNAGCRFGVRSQ